MNDLLLLYLSIIGALISVGWCKSILYERSYHNQIAFVWYDLWIGAYYSREKQLFYVIPFPTIVFIFDWRKP